MGIPSTRINSITEEELASLTQAFSLYDINKNGYIRLSEFENIIQGLGIAIDKEAIGKELDENQDGKIDFREFVKAMNKLISQPLTEEPESVDEKPHYNKRNNQSFTEKEVKSRSNSNYMRHMSRHESDELRRCFKRFDKNNDGYISFAELTEVMGELGESLAEEDLKDMMADADTNRDGFIDFEEFKNLMPSN